VDSKARDGTVPAWSAFHAYCENENRYDLTQTQGTEHSNLLNHDEVLTLIENVVTTGKLSAARPPRSIHGVSNMDRRARFYTQLLESSKPNCALTGKNPNGVKIMRSEAPTHGQHYA
jgi:hypothetical protein